MSEEKLQEAADLWWGPAGLSAPFTPGYVSGNNDGKVRDANGRVVCDFGGCEAAADVIAALLNLQDIRMNG